jgi:uncharacterized protein YggT (Ycf19 family)
MDNIVDNKLAIDEARRAAQYENVKGQAEAGVNQQILSQTQQVTPQEAAPIEQFSQNLKQQAVEDLATTEQEVARGRVLARVSQVVDYLFYVIYSLLAIRLLLNLMAARKGAGFVQFVYSLSDPFYAPFKGIVASPSVDGGFTLALPIVIALFVYLLLHLGINGLLRMGAHRKVAI